MQLLSTGIFEGGADFFNFDIIVSQQMPKLAFEDWPHQLFSTMTSPLTL